MPKYDGENLGEDTSGEDDDSTFHSTTATVFVRDTHVKFEICCCVVVTLCSQMRGVLFGLIKLVGCNPIL
jgi:hypothetical protein